MHHIFQCTNIFYCHVASFRRKRFLFLTLKQLLHNNCWNSLIYIFSNEKLLCILYQPIIQIIQYNIWFMNFDKSLNELKCVNDKKIVKILNKKVQNIMWNWINKEKNDVEPKNICKSANAIYSQIYVCI